MEAKVKAGIFVGPQIKKIIECDEFAKNLNRNEKVAWNSFFAVGNNKAENYEQLAQTLIKNHAKMTITRLKTMSSWFRLSRTMPKWDAECPSKSTFLMLIWINSRRIWELT